MSLSSFLDGIYSLMGFYDIGSDYLQWENRELWLGNYIPKDRSIITTFTRVISAPLYAGFCIASTFGILISIILLFFNEYYRDRRIIEMSQKNVNNLMLVGCIACFTCIFVNGLDARLINRSILGIVCQVRVWLLCGGFSLSYGALFSKIWTIYRLTTRGKAEIKVVKETETYMIIGACLLADVIVLTLWQIIDPFKVVMEKFSLEKSQNSDVDMEILPQLEHCSSEQFNVWFGIIVGVKGILLLLGILLAYETRNIKVKNINDLRFVGLSVYNVVVLCVITAPVTWVINSHQDTTFAFVSTAILLCNFLTMGFIFIPKVLHIRKYPTDADVDPQTDSQKLEEENHKKLLQQNDELKKMIKEKEERIAHLKQQLKSKMNVFGSEETTTMADVLQESALDLQRPQVLNLKKRNSTPMNTSEVTESCRECYGPTAECNGLLKRITS